MNVAISFMDVADFSDYTAAEGDEAAVALLESFLDVAEMFVRGARGRVIKRLGDGLMAAFPGAAEAVRASVAVQQALQARATLSTDRPIPRAHIGVHWGSPIERDGDLFGYDVNLTARLAEAARPGQVLVTEAVKEEVAPRLHGVRLRAIGVLKGKGIAEPVPVYEALPGPGGPGEVAPVSLPEGWVLAANLFDIATPDSEDMLEFARDAEAAVVGLGGRIMFLGIVTGSGIGTPRMVLSLIAFPAVDAFEAYVHDPGLEHLRAARATVIEREDLHAYLPIMTMRWAGPFGVPAPAPAREVPELPLVDQLRQRRKRRFRLE